MIELNLISQETKILDIDGVKVELVKATPLVQANLINKMQGVETSDIIKHVDIMQYYFENIITKVVYKGVDYSGKDFFDMLNITDVGIQTFVANVISGVVSTFFLSGEEAKK